MRTGYDDDAGALFRLDADGGWAQIESGVAIGNAISFSPDGETLYFADSLDKFNPDPDEDFPLAESFLTAMPFGCILKWYPFFSRTLFMSMMTSA